VLVKRKRKREIVLVVIHKYTYACMHAFKDIQYRNLHTCTHVNTHTHAHMQIHTHAHHIPTYQPTYAHKCTRAQTRTHAVHMHAGAHTRTQCHGSQEKALEYIHTYVQTYIQTYIRTHKKTYMQTYIHTKTHTSIEINAYKCMCDTSYT